MDILDGLNEEELNFVEEYKALFNKISTLQTRMKLLEQDLDNSIKELNNLRELEKQYNEKNG